jgi:hypothetical protein
MNAAPSRQWRWVRRDSAATMSRSFSKAWAGFGDTGSCVSSRCVFRNSSGSSTMRRRSEGVALFHAA